MREQAASERAATALTEVLTTLCQAVASEALHEAALLRTLEELAAPPLEQVATARLEGALAAARAAGVEVGSLSRFEERLEEAKAEQRKWRLVPQFLLAETAERVEPGTLRTLGRGRGNLPNPQGDRKAPASSNKGGPAFVTVSGTHVELRFSDSPPWSVVVTDLSSFGTHVNGTRLEKGKAASFDAVAGSIRLDLGKQPFVSYTIDPPQLPPPEPQASVSTAAARERSAEVEGGGKRARRESVPAAGRPSRTSRETHAQSRTQSLTQSLTQPFSQPFSLPSQSQPPTQLSQPETQSQGALGTQSQPDPQPQPASRGEPPSADRDACAVPAKRQRPPRKRFEVEGESEQGGGKARRPPAPAPSVRAAASGGGGAGSSAPSSSSSAEPASWEGRMAVLVGLVAKRACLPRLPPLPPLPPLSPLPPSPPLTPASHCLRRPAPSQARAERQDRDAGQVPRHRQKPGAIRRGRERGGADSGHQGRKPEAAVGRGAAGGVDREGRRAGGRGVEGGAGGRYGAR